MYNCSSLPGYFYTTQKIGSCISRPDLCGAFDQNTPHAHKHREATNNPVSSVILIISGFSRASFPDSPYQFMHESSPLEMAHAFLCDVEIFCQLLVFRRFVARTISQ